MSAEISLLSDRPSAIYQFTEKNKKNFKIAAVVILAIATIGIVGSAFRYLTIKQKEITALNEIKLQAQSLSREIENLRQQAQPGWQQAAMKLLRKARYDLPSDELLRLKMMNVLTDALSQKLDEAIKKVKPNVTAQQLDQIKIIIAQAFEIKLIYKETHHVLIHAQASEWLGMTYIIKELMKKSDPNCQLQHFKCLRPPFTVTNLKANSSIWNTVKSFFWSKPKTETVQDYLGTKDDISDKDKETREHLLSADGYFLNSQPAESSLYFLAKNSNMLMKKDVITDLYTQILQRYYTNLPQEIIKNCASDLFDSFQQKNPPCGNLFTICVPKEKSCEIQYRAHPFGRVCSCHPTKDSVPILERLQDEEFSEETECKIQDKIPQFRIYTPKLKPGVTPIYRSTPYPKAARIEMKNKIRLTLNNLGVAPIAPSNKEDPPLLRQVLAKIGF